MVDNAEDEDLQTFVSGLYVGQEVVKIVYKESRPDCRDNAPGKRTKARNVSSGLGASFSELVEMSASDRSSF